MGGGVLATPLVRASGDVGRYVAYVRRGEMELRRFLGHRLERCDWVQAPEPSRRSAARIGTEEMAMM